jgi:hypothetical protein
MPPTDPGPAPSRPPFSRAVVSPATGIAFPRHLTVRPAVRPLSGERTVVLALAALVVIAAVFRVQHLDSSGFSQDEINKVQAVRAYARGDVSANAEHPMLMKLAALASTAGASAWNEVARRAGWPEVAPEGALRLPNALVGAATVVPLFLLARSFFGPLVAVWAALLLALDVTVTGLNRIGKEDTFLVFFLLLAAWCHEEARRRHQPGGTPPHRWYVAGGAAFGLMLASKYMIYYLGLWAVFRLAVGAEQRRERPADEAVPSRRIPKSFYAAMALAFVVANPVVLLPGTWLYLLHYVGGGTVAHHGAYFAGRIYPNAITDTPWGLPWHFYLLYIGLKTPLPILAAIGLGVGELVRRRRERGAVFARVFLLFFLLPASLAASKFARYLLPTLVVLEMVAALGLARALDSVSQWKRGPWRVTATATLMAVVVGSALGAQAAAAPFASLHLNAIGRLVAAPGSLFPNDELYDTGVREAVEWIARQAAAGAVVASDAPGVVAEYARRAGRPDIEARSLSRDGLPPPTVDGWLLAQKSHACFESEPLVEQARLRGAPVFVYSVLGTPAVEAFRLGIPWSSDQRQRTKSGLGADHAVVPPGQTPRTR